MKNKGKNQHVVPSADGWAVRSEGSSHDTLRTSTQREAIEKARQIAKEHQTDVFIHNKDGAIRTRETYAPAAGQGWAVPNTQNEKKPPTSVASAPLTKRTKDQYLTDRVVVSREISHGKPRIAGTRIMVHLILDLLAAGVTPDEITSEDYYPELTVTDIYACIEYASRVVQNDDFAPVQ